MNNEDIARKIIELKNSDLELRNRLLKKGQLAKRYNKEMEKLHNRNAAELQHIIDDIGYPTIDKVGEEASDAAWLIIQHAISQPEFMRNCAESLKKAVDEDKADPKHLAYLVDRIAVFEGKPQLYGTQFDWDEHGEMSPNSFDDLAKVNHRRKSIGLNTLEEQIDIMRARVRNENQAPPTDIEERRMQYNHWRRTVGWI